MAERKPWDRLPDETKRAYEGFHRYCTMRARLRSIDAAWREDKRASGEHVESDQRAPARWFAWSKQFNWPRRAAAYDEHLAEQDRMLWEERRHELQRRDWEQADALRDVIERAIPNAEHFIERRTTRVGDETIITLAFDIDALARVLVHASKLQRLATDEPTDIFRNLSGAALDALLAAEIAKLIHAGEAGDVGAHLSAEAGDDEPPGGVA